MGTTSMSATVRDLVRRVSPIPDLMDAATLSRIEETLAEVPADLCPFVAFESAIHAPAPTVSAMIYPGWPAHSWLASQSLQGWEPVARLAEVASGRLRRFLLEFDTDVCASPAPSVYAEPWPPDHMDWTWIRQVALPRLGSTTDLPERLVATLPTDTRVLAFGVMNGRTSAARLYVKELSRVQVTQWLETNGWPGDLGVLSSALAELAPWVRAFGLGVEMAESGMQARIGIEIYRREQGSWLPALDWLVAHGLCSSARREALLAWPSRTAVTGENTHLADMMALTGRQAIQSRDLGLIKLIVGTTGRVVGAKMYFWQSFEWS
jgi:hypothetical protein